MDKTYVETIRLLLTAAPEVFANDIFAMKGGTAINLFVQDLPRFSNDIDVVYIRTDTTREQALQEIAAQLAMIADRLHHRGLQTRLIRTKDLGDTKLVVEDETSQVLIEVNTIFRGTVLPIERRRLSARTAQRFSVELELPVLMVDELYAGKLLAAMDRQHPRDLFDVWRLYDSGGITDAMVECFVTYLAGHNRPTHEVVFGNDRDITTDYHDSFVGTTAEEVSLATLLEARKRLRQELPARMTRQQRQFLISLAHARPDWSLLQCEHAAQLPALQWKLHNLKIFRHHRPADFERQAQLLETRLS